MYFECVQMCISLIALFQGRQKLARFNAREFATLIIDILSDAKRRQIGCASPVHTPRDQGRCFFYHTSIYRQGP